MLLIPNHHTKVISTSFAYSLAERLFSILWKILMYAENKLTTSTAALPQPPSTSTHLSQNNSVISIVNAHNITNHGRSRRISTKVCRSRSQFYCKRYTLYHFNLSEMLCSIQTFAHALCPIYNWYSNVFLWWDLPHCVCCFAGES